MKKSFSELNDDQRAQALATFINAARNDGFLYQLTSDGRVLARSRVRTNEELLRQYHDLRGRC